MPFKLTSFQLEKIRLSFKSFRKLHLKEFSSTGILILEIWIAFYKFQYYCLNKLCSLACLFNLETFVLCIASYTYLKSHFNLGLIFDCKGLWKYLTQYTLTILCTVFMWRAWYLLYNVNALRSVQYALDQHWPLLSSLQVQPSQFVTQELTRQNGTP